MLVGAAANGGKTPGMAEISHSAGAVVAMKQDVSLLRGVDAAAIGAILSTIKAWHHDC